MQAIMASRRELRSPDSEALLHGERRVLELLATNHDLSTVLDELCRLIDAQSGLITSIYVLNRDTRQKSFAAGPRVPEPWRSLTRTIPATATGGACGAAIAQRRAVLVEDVQSSELYRPKWREAARASNIVSIWSTPFFASDGRALGTFAIVSSTRLTADSPHSPLIRRAAQLAGIAVERYQAVEGLAESERRFAAAFYSNPAIMTITRATDGRFLYVNDRFVEVFGHSRAESVGRTALELGLWAEPEQRQRIQEQLRQHGTVTDFEATTRTRSGALLECLVCMARIQILGEDCVLTITCDITERNRNERELAASEQLLRVVLDTLPVGVAVVNSQGDMTLTNQATKRIWGGQLLPGHERDAKRRGRWHATGAPIAPDAWASARALRSGEISLNEVIDIDTFDGVSKTIQHSSVPIRDPQGVITGAVIVNEDITARQAAERGLQDALARQRALTGDLMRAQDDERRRIARLLHETTAQDLAVLKMHLRRLTRNGAAQSEDDRAALAESIELAERSIAGIRTLSYVMYPPFLDDAGLLAALRWYADGFSERSGIRVTLDLPPMLERLSRDAETALFRVVQESLINIHRHADSETATIRLRVEGDRLWLEVEDRGRGVSPELVATFAAGGGGGAGLAAMRERLRQLDGVLRLTSTASGTIVRTELPLEAVPQ